MKNLGKGPVFIVILLVTVLIIILAVSYEGKKDYEQVQKIQQTVESSDATAEEIGNAINKTNEMIQSQYDDIDDAQE